MAPKFAVKPRGDFGAVSLWEVGRAKLTLSGAEVSRDTLEETSAPFVCGN